MTVTRSPRGTAALIVAALLLAASPATASSTTSSDGYYPSGNQLSFKNALITE